MLFEPELYSANWPSAGLLILCVVFAETNVEAHKLPETRNKSSFLSSLF